MPTNNTPVATANTKATEATTVAKATTKATSPVATKRPVKAAVKAKAAAKPAPAAKPITGKTVAAKKAPAVSKAASAEKPVKAKKIKMVRDSFTFPKPEFAVLEELKLRGAKLSAPVKKTELIRAGIKALAAMGDANFLAAIRAVPSLKTGRPAKV